MANIINIYTLSFVIVTAFTVMAYLLHLVRRRQLLNVIPLFLSIVTVLLLYRLIGAAGSADYYNILAIDICIATIATILAIFYISKPYIFMTLVILLIVGFLIYANSYTGNTGFAGMFAIGTTYGLLYREFALNPKKRVSEASRRNKKREINRDVIQIVLGAVLVMMLYIFPYFQAVSIIFGLIILAYTSNNLLANLRLGPAYKRVTDLERKDVTFGLGATYLATGAALVMGFTHSTNLMLFGVAVLFFADSLATIVGMGFRNATPLPYNRFKTMAGTLAFFIVAAIAGYLLVGWYGVLFALILAFVESLNLSLDDNIRNGIVIVILNALL